MTLRAFIQSMTSSGTVESIEGFLTGMARVQAALTSPEAIEKYQAFAEGAARVHATLTSPEAIEKYQAFAEGAARVHATLTSPEAIEKYQTLEAALAETAEHVSSPASDTFTSDEEAAHAREIHHLSVELLELGLKVPSEVGKSSLVDECAEALQSGDLLPAETMAVLRDISSTDDLVKRPPSAEQIVAAVREADPMLFALLLAVVPKVPMTSFK